MGERLLVCPIVPAREDNESEKPTCFRLKNCEETDRMKVRSKALTPRANLHR